MKRSIFTLITLLLFTQYTFSQNSIMFTAKIDGSQEVPAVTTTATGTGTFVLSANGTQLTYHITVNGLSGAITGSHFHNAAAGTGGGVVKAFSFSGNTASGTWTSADANQPLTDLLLSELLKGKLYVNIHTAANPGGEIRGQVLLSTGVGFSAKLEGSQEVPAVTTTASGTGSVRLNTDGTVSYDITAGGLTPTAAHFHNAGAGTAGGVAKSITLTNNTGAGVWASGDASQPLTDLLLRELVKGRLYMNVHTSANAGGEIRGQVLLNSGASFTAKMDGSQEVPAVTTTATGTGSFVLSANGTQLTYNITVNGLSGAITGSHFHNAAAGTGGGVVKAFTFNGNTASGVWTSADANQPLTDLLLSELLKGKLYVNVHTSANAGGEIRGQVLFSTGMGFTAKLEGSQETPAITTTASGTGSVRLNTDGTVSYDLTAGGLTPTAAHFHNAAAGISGGVVKSITLTNNTALGIWSSVDVTQPLTDLLLRELVKGKLYMNVHTLTNPGGEIRGQVVNSTEIASGIESTDSQELPSRFTLSQNYPNPFNPTTVIQYAVPFESKVNVTIFNSIGQVVKTYNEGNKNAGSYSIRFNGERLASGVYLYNIKAFSLDGKQNFHATKKMLLIK
ncbi:MAG: CHRD domain-containing protein [Ignavibacteriales bacterium]|nr:CHRD domain-containing protein [Ignavibacteriales bacterium]